MKLALIRDEKRMSLPVRLAERPNQSKTGSDEFRGLGTEPSADEPEPPLGLVVRDINRSAIGRYNLPASLEGVLITKVDPTGAAFSLPLRPGFVITDINRRRVRSLADYERVFATVKPGDVLAIHVYDHGNAQRRLLTVTVER